VQKFHEALEVGVHIVNPGFGGMPIAILECDNEDEDVAEKNVAVCKNLFFSLAGYCSCEDYDKWFQEV